MMKKGEARVQFIAHLDEIMRMLGDGYSMSAAYKKLAAMGKVTMTLRTFTNLCRPDVLKAQQKKQQAKKKAQSQ